MEFCVYVQALLINNRINPHNYRGKFLTSFKFCCLLILLIRPGGQWTVVEEEGHDGGPQRVRQRDHMHKGSNQLNYKNIGIEN